jgi:hypothetical protein
VCVTYLEDEGAKLTIAGDDAEGAQKSFHGGKAQLHLPEVEEERVEDVEEVEERLGPRPVPGAS